MTLVTAFLPDEESEPARGRLDFPLPLLLLAAAPSAPSAPAPVSVFSLEE